MVTSCQRVWRASGSRVVSVSACSPTMLRSAGSAPNSRASCSSHESACVGRSGRLPPPPTPLPPPSADARLPLLPRRRAPAAAPSQPCPSRFARERPLRLAADPNVLTSRLSARRECSPLPVRSERRAMSVSPVVER
eukprot:37897-Chlamydomonas_euryale.AAC.1